jgi:hypothetical protein
MATRRTPEVAPYLIGPAYAVALLFVLWPIVDTLSQTWPMQLGNPSWRYGTIGIGANYMISVLFGLLGLSAFAALGTHRRTLKALAIVCGAVAVLLLVVALGFLLDALQVRAGIPQGETRTRSMFDIGVAKAAVKYVLSALVLGWLALASWKGARAMPRPMTEEESPKLVGEHRK